MPPPLHPFGVRGGLQEKGARGSGFQKKGARGAGNQARRGWGRAAVQAPTEVGMRPAILGQTWDTAPENPLTELVRRGPNAHRARHD